MHLLACCLPQQAPSCKSSETYSEACWWSKKKADRCMVLVLTYSQQASSCRSTEPILGGASLQTGAWSCSSHANKNRTRKRRRRAVYAFQQSQWETPTAAAWSYHMLTASLILQAFFSSDFFFADLETRNIMYVCMYVLQAC